MDPSKNPNYDDHEKLVFLADEPLGLLGVIAIHSTALGPAAGGCRMAAYPGPAEALTDALRLSQGMSYKNAMAGLPAGGGKAVLYRVDPDAPREAVFEAFGAAVEALGGAYVTSEDVGVGVADMVCAARRTSHVAGLPAPSGQAGGDPSPWTALGVFEAMAVAAGRPLAGARIAVQGLGSVGYKLCERLHAAGARLVVADVDPARTAAARTAFGADVVPVETVHRVDADVFSPNALGATLNAGTIGDLGAPVVCGGANNQLAGPEDGRRLLARGITYAPDYVVNAGGIINVMAEHLGEPALTVGARVRAIGPRLGELLDLAREERCPPHQVADRIARQRIGRGGRAPAT